jgi:hypothetical protein
MDLFPHLLKPSASTKFTKDQIFKAVNAAIEDLNTYLEFESFHFQYQTATTNGQQATGQYVLNPLHLGGNKEKKEKKKDTTNITNWQLFTSISSAFPKQFRAIRELLLDIWEVMLVVLQKLDDKDLFVMPDQTIIPSRDNHENNYYRLVFLIKKR